MLYFFLTVNSVLFGIGLYQNFFKNPPKIFVFSLSILAANQTVCSSFEQRSVIICC